RNSGPVKEWKKNAEEIEKIGEEYAAIESPVAASCNLLASSLPFHIPQFVP
ncbi:hypothetical protein KI387_015226, partial [Taxus chinensis]